MPLEVLRDSKFPRVLWEKLRLNSLPFSPSSNLQEGGTGTLSCYKGKTGILTAFHVVHKNLKTKKIYAPIIQSSTPEVSYQHALTVRNIWHLEKIDSTKSLNEMYSGDWPESSLDICFIEIEWPPDIKGNMVIEPVDLVEYKNKYEKTIDKYLLGSQTWFSCFLGYPREAISIDESGIIHAPYGGIYFAPLEVARITPIITSKEFNGGVADLFVHKIGQSKDQFPKEFSGISGSGMWQVRFQGENGIPHKIDELFLGGIIVAENEYRLTSRGSSALFEVFLPYLDSVL